MVSCAPNESAKERQRGHSDQQKEKAGREGRIGFRVPLTSAERPARALEFISTKEKGDCRMDLTEKILFYMKRYHMIPENKNIVVGLSGGADSVCLLYVLVALRKKLGLRCARCMFIMACAG